MSKTYYAHEYKTWDDANLKDFGDFCDIIQYVNQSEYGDGQYQGQWYFDDKDAMTIYSGTFGNEWSPGSSHYTVADVYESAEEFRANLAAWEALPEYLE